MAVCTARWDTHTVPGESRGPARGLAGTSRAALATNTERPGRKVGGTRAKLSAAAASRALASLATAGSDAEPRATLVAL